MTSDKGSHSRDYLRNCWYVAAWADELARGDKIARTILNEEILLFRDDEGEATAIANRCPHRFAPLDQGELTGGVIQCPYHGLRFDKTGACVHNPHGDGKIPAQAKVRRYPLVERYANLWIWMGNEEADPDQIPNFESHIDPDHRLIKGHLTMHAFYELVTDNLMDLSHVRFLHPTTLAPPEGSREEHKIHREGRHIYSNLLVTGGNAPPAWDMMFDNYGKPVDHWLDMRWTAPSALLLDVGVTKPEEAREEGFGVLFSHILTPETDSSTHYFWGCARTKKKDDPAIDAIWHNSIDVAFLQEDGPMALSQQEFLGTRDLEAAGAVVLPSDAAALQCRRTVRKLIQQETGTA